MKNKNINEPPTQHSFPQGSSVQKSEGENPFVALGGEARKTEKWEGQFTNEMLYELIGWLQFSASVESTEEPKAKDIAKRALAHLEQNMIVFIVKNGGKV